MNRRPCALLLVVSLTIPTLCAGDEAPAPRRSIADVAWIAGDWQTPAGDGPRIDEHWTAPSGGAMMGVSRTVAGGRLVEFEFLRIVERDGAVLYVAQPGGRCPATEFTLTSVTASRAIFENPQHDFPKRIVYERQPDGSLVAAIDAGEGTKAMVFGYRATGR